jgi:nitroimidazol reductase NimA-like FMN-containing flavoprotein (pyridoxamine 5'-phosphate oxidase superfamily)
MRELSDAEIDDVLMRNGIGTLALVDDGVPYPIPMSFGYDGEKPLFVMQFGDEGKSRKLACLDTSQAAGFLVYGQVEEGLGAEWRSAVLLGQLQEVEDDSNLDAYTALASNAEFAPDVSAWGPPLDETELTLLELAVEERSGRAFSMDA